MDYNNKKHIITYIIVGGFVFYILSAIISSIFIISVPQDKDWCLESIEIQVSENDYKTECIEFKNDFEMLKYYHNKEMVRRNKYLVFLEFILAFLATSLFFYFIPKWKGHVSNEDNASKFLILTLIAFLISTIAPLIFSWILPAPVNWFPQIFKDINDAQVNEVLRNLR